MKRTSWLVLATVALIGGGFGLLTQWLLVSRGFSALVIPLTLSSVCVVLGAILVGLAWPIRQRLHSETSRPRIDPLYSVRVVLLAKASSLTGSLLGGTALGFFGFALSRPVINEEHAWLAGGGIVGAIVLTVGGALAEMWCILPPEAGGDQTEPHPEGETA